MGTKPKDWSLWLPRAKWCYNRTAHSSTGLTPIESLYDYPAPKLLSNVQGTTANVAVDQQLRTREELMGLLTKNLQRAQQRMKFFTD